MGKGSKDKSVKLGMSYSKAAHRLRRKILFTLAKRCGMTKCYRCDEEITDEVSLSVEHKIGWQYSEDPIKMFWDIDNIAFSHKSCNSAVTSMRHFSQGKSKYKGVSFDSSKIRKKRWKAFIDQGGKHTTFGRFETEKEAAEAYDREVTELFGNQAITNKNLGLL